MNQKAYITGVEYYLPANRRENIKDRLTKKTGINAVHLSEKDETASDLAFKAAQKLFSTGLEQESIDFLLFCTQSPDYFLPTTACILQNRLGLSKSCGALDFNLGCSGYVYGLSLAKGLIETGQAKKVLLLTGETYSKYINHEDNTVKPLFGDAGTATIIETIDSKSDGISSFVFGTDGAGYENLIVPVGGSRNPLSNTEIVAETDKFGNKRDNSNLYMNGAAISDFALEVVPLTVENILKKASLTRSEVDYYVFHQANKFMLQFIQQKCDLIEVPFWNDVNEYGNTVSCSIPIALTDLMKTSLPAGLERVMLIGFGVGLSWAGCMVNLSHCK